MTDRVDQLKRVQAEALDLFERKNADYGDAFAAYGPIGVLVRMQDKISRAVSVTDSRIQMVDGERLRDTLVDLVNYSCMAIMLIDEKSTS